MAHNIPISFKIYAGDELVRTESLTQDIIKVGKLQSSHLRIDDDNVSRMHAVIEVTSPTEVFIIDLGSASGTVVNGKKVNKAQLNSGDELTLGGSRVVVEIGAAAAVAAPPPAAPPPRAPAPPPIAKAAPPAPAAAAAPAAPAAPAVAAAPPPPKPAAPAATPFAASAAAPNPFGAAKKALPNPFAPPPTTSSRSLEDVDLSTIDPEKLTYGVVASGPPVDPNEVETAEQALEVMVMWGKSVLHVDHLKPARTFWVGEPEGKEEVDYLIAPDILGMSRMPVCVVSGGSTAMVFPQGATGEVMIGDQTTAIESINLGACPEVPNAQQYLVPDGAMVRVNWKGFTFMVRSVKAGKKVATGFSLDWVPLAYLGGVMLFVGALLTAMYFSPPPVAGLNNDIIDPNSRLAQFIIEPPETEEPPEEEEEAPSEDAGGTGTAHEGESGAMGDERAERTDNHYSIQGDANPEDQQMARQEAREQAATAGVVGALAALSGSFMSPTSPYGGDQAIGAGEISALGALTGSQAGSNFGMGGLGLTGTGRGGGGFGQGTIGMGTIGTIGHGSGRGTGSGIGDGGGLGDRQASRPQIRPGTAAVRGSLSADVIRRVVRRHLGEVRFCYEQALNSQPDLRGTVSVRWIISPTGSVTTSTVSGSTLGSARVESCVASAVRRWTFPAPDGGGLVSVTYPFTLESN
ncbi:MAG: TonB family protein [Sandaracinaceae bacterium]|nr:TonB family protein [Sandaracinaceae bacterium]